MANTGGTKPDKPTPPNPRLKKMPPRGFAGWMMFVALALMLAVLVSRSRPAPRQATINEFYTWVENNQIESLVLRDETLTGERKFAEGDTETTQRRFELLYPPTAMDQEFLTYLRTKLPNTRITREQESIFLKLMLNLLPWLLAVAFLWFFLFRQLRNAGPGGGMLGSFGRSRHRVSSKEHTNVTFADVAGVQEAKDEVAEIIEFLKCPKKFQRLGGRIPRGVLLVGEPGCGKTLLAKAIAGEADVPFFSISGSDFVEMFVGVGASRVRDLFKQAKENSPCIIFLDEIDAVGRRRGASFGGGGHDEREQTLNAILVEMDGFDTSDQVIVIAATNRVDVLDPALIRPGRFDRQVYVSLPDLQGRYEILKVHARKIKLGANVDLRRLARGTPMFSGADLAAIINEAALAATMIGKDYVEQEDLEEARDKVRWGRVKKSRSVDERDRRITAYHEAGHALVQALQKEGDPIHKVSIIPRGPMGGATFSLPERDRSVYTRGYLLAILNVTFGGRIGEEMFCGDISSGAAQDIRQATDIARRMVKEWGMADELGFVWYGDDEDTRPLLLDANAPRRYSDSTAEQIDQALKRIVDNAYQHTKDLMAANRGKVEALAKALMEYETLSGDEVNAIIRGEPLERPTVADLLDAEQNQSDTVGEARPVSAERIPRPDDLGGTLPQPG